ncbi:MAG TPA: PAS domain S-box protein, partial [Armatimonadota bacterium]|nr:PAS domain S-box protein [Armatimonadota bacterium]
EAALQTVVSKARCLIWEYEVIDEGGAQLRWRPRVFDEAAAQRFLPLDTTGYPSYAAAWYLSRLDHDRESSDHYGETQVRLGRSYRQEFRCRDRDGAIRWLMEDVQVETVGPGRWQAVGVCTDITELREAEYRRRESLATLRAVMEGAADAIFVKDRDGRYLIINAAGAQMLGRTVDQVIGAHDTELFTADTVQQILDRDQAVLSTGERSSYEATATAAGVTRIYHATKGPMFGPDGAVVGVIGISRDVTERKQAEVALRESEERFRAVFESAGIGVEVTTLEGGVVMSNEVMQRMLGYSAPELRRMHIHDYVHPDYLSTDRALFEELVAGKLDRYQAEKRYVRKNGTEFLGRLTSSLVRDQAGAPQSVVRMVEDITEYRAATTALHLRDSAIRALPTGLLITDATQPENPISYVNPAFTEITGYPPEEALGRNTGFLEAPNADPATTDAILQAVRTGERIDCEVLNARKDGTLFWNALCIAPIRDPEGHLTHWVGIQQDVTQRRRLEEQLRQAQKMEAVGRLAGGVAHDFNNMLAVINGYASLLLPHARDDEFLRSGLGEIAKAGDRAAGLTRQLLAFSRQQVMELKDVDLHAVVENMTTMLGRLIGEDIDLLVIAAPGLGTVRADPGQIEQCLLNLA